ncbi:Rieske (2Fe-2S) protein [Pseudonocardia sp. RS11V-5]|uniref:Rieske (2Fe-2S) protein n=1 Tax=Pseudonocardia terrae TaxID=2905831 RepID=UPI001E3C9E0C|nr:Rieske (2Fe-2S) protein [Pseudonocardia terrae]MCE3554223.1 Rieske (2Fe-2S) protein [Pseudonocardia terrae]
MPENPDLAPASPASPVPALTRRAAVAGAGAAALGIGLLAAGCVTGGSGSTGGDSRGGGVGGGAPPAHSTTLGPASSVPVGSAVVFADENVIVTQPTAGTYQGLSATCPHESCTVTDVQGAVLVCPCHGSVFGLEGQLLKGPATGGLKPVKVTVSGGLITRG